MEFYYLPALTLGGKWHPGGNASNQRINKSKKYRGHPPEYFNWMDAEAIDLDAYYPHALISYYGLRNVALEFPKDGYILGDSGGFSVMRYGAKDAPIMQLDPRRVLQWQNLLCSTGVIIDVPPTTMIGEGRGKPKSWSHNLEATRKNVERCLSVHQKIREENTRFRWWGVVHGWTNAQRDLWWKTVANEYPFSGSGEGWAMRARPVAHDPTSIAWGLHWLRIRKIKRTHFFAALGAKQFATVLVLGPEAGLDFATVDSTGMTSTYARNRGIMTLDPNGLSYNTLKESEANPTNVDLNNRTYREARDYCLEHCTCASCRLLQHDAKDSGHPLHLGKDSRRWVAGANTYWTYRFEFHNVLILKQIVENQQREIQHDPHKMLREVLGKDYHVVLRAFDGNEPMKAATSEARSLYDYL